MVWQQGGEAKWRLPLPLTRELRPDFLSPAPLPTALPFMLDYRVATVKAGEARSPGALRARAR